MNKNVTNTFWNHETRVSSLEEAITLACKWQMVGKYDFFRGQGRNWDLLSSIHRKKSQKLYERNFDRLKLLYLVAEDNPVLKEYIHNIDDFIAIAQHYGIATNFIDFTTDPSIAAYFATHSSANRVGEYSCIICAKGKDCMRIACWAEKMHVFNSPRPEFLSLNIKNLWRLQAQKGHFLYTPFAGIENLYRFHRILFPYSKPFEGLKENDIYPIEKSSLETNLDYFFSAEREYNNMSRIIKWIKEENVSRLSRPNIFDYINLKSKPHYSWRPKNSSPWHHNVEEHWNDIEKRTYLELLLPFSKVQNMKAVELVDLIGKKLDENSCRSTVARIKVKRTRMPFNKKLQDNIQKGVNLIWNGMRNLPYTNTEIALSISRFIIMYFQERFKDHSQYKPWEIDTVYIGMSIGDGSHSNAHIGAQNILNAKRRNLNKYLNSEYQSICEDNPVALTQLIFEPKYLFSFKGFRQLFVSDAIPSQTVLAVTDKNPVIYFNPIQIKVFGLA
jgi:hypothetical protein